MRRFLLAMSLCLAPVFSPVSATAQTAADFLAAIHLDPVYRQSLRDRGYTGAHFEVMVDHTRKLFSDRGILSGLERKISAGLAQTGYEPGAVFFQSLDYTLIQAYGVGLSRLSASERQQLFSVDAGFLQAIPTRECNRMVVGTLNPERESKLFDAYVTQIPAQTLSGYYAATRKAMRLGLERNASAKPLTQREVLAAEEAIYPIIDQLIARQKNPGKLYDAWSKGPGATGRYACAFNQMFSAAAMSLKGANRDLAIRYLMSQ